MSKYNVEMFYTIECRKTLTIYAKDENEAEDKAIDLVSGWTDVRDCEVMNIEEFDNE